MQIHFVSYFAVIMGFYMLPNYVIQIIIWLNGIWHTPRHVASVRYAALSNGVPHPVLAGGTLSTPGRGMEYPPSRPGMEYPPISWMGCPHTWTWDGVPPVKTWDGVPPPPHLDPGWSTPPPSRPLTWTWDGVFPPCPDLSPPSRCGLTNKRKTVPSPILRMRTVINYRKLFQKIENDKVIYHLEVTDKLVTGTEQFAPHVEYPTRSPSPSLRG